MTYAASEISVASGYPIELYHIAAETGQTWRYNSSPEGNTITYASHDYTPENVKRRNVKISDRSFVNELELEFDHNNEFASQFISAPIEGRVTLTIYRGHDGNYITFWVGNLISVNFDTNGESKCIFSPRISTMPRVGKRRLVSKMCGFCLYDSQCRVNDVAYRVEGVLSDVDGVTLTSATFALYADNYFKAGKITIGNAVRLVVGHTTSTITINRVISDAAIGSSFAIYPGCDHTATTCLSKFGNIYNFGGLPYLPLANPFTTSNDDYTTYKVKSIFDKILDKWPLWGG